MQKRKGEGTMPNANISILADENNIPLIGKCMQKADAEVPKILEAGAFVRRYHYEGQRNSDSQCRCEPSLSTGKKIIDSINHTRRPRVRLFGQNISEAIHILRSYFGDKNI